MAVISKPREPRQAAEHAKIGLTWRKITWHEVTFPRKSRFVGWPGNR
jgi:hypothetical protein